MRIALFESERDNLPSTGEVSWDALARDLTLHERTDCDPCVGKDCPKKFGQAWSPTDYPDGSKRASANVRAITAAVFDLEGEGHTALPDATLAALGRAIGGLRYICHSTHSPGAYRLILALSRPVLPHEWPTVHAAIIQRFNLPADRTCGDLARLYFFPSCPKSAPEPVACTGEGEPLDVDALLASSPVLAGSTNRAQVYSSGGATVENANSPSAENGNVTSRPEKWDLETLRAGLRKVMRAESRTLAKRILAGEALALPGARDDTVNAAASLVASAPDIPPSAGEALALLAPSIRAMDCAPEGEEHWLRKAEDSFKRAIVRRSQRDDQRAKDKETVLGLLGRVESVPTGANGADPDWRKRLIPNIVDGEPVGIKACEFNVELILTNDPTWKGTLRFNEVTKEIDVTSGPLAKRQVGDLEVATCGWFQESAYKIFMHPYQFGPLLLSAARLNAYDPLAEYLNGLKWDGTARIDQFLVTYFGADDIDHNRRVGRKWLISAVARALAPGSKVDTVLILEGAYGVGKSTALRVLGEPYFSDTKVTLGDKDSRLMVSRFWILEMAELAALRQQDSESLKAFFSAQSDAIRPPYGRRVEEFKRRCVLVGTTNSDDYLLEPNRREWPVLCGKINKAKLQTDRDQLWAEAVVAFKAGESWWLEDEEQREAMEVAEARQTVTGEAEAIRRWFYSIPRDKRPKSITTYDVAQQALDIPKAQMVGRSQLFVAIGRVLRKMGFVRRQVRVGATREWRFEVPIEFLEGTLRLAPEPRASEEVIASARVPKCPTP